MNRCLALSLFRVSHDLSIIITVIDLNSNGDEVRYPGGPRECFRSQVCYVRLIGCSTIDGI